MTRKVLKSLITIFIFFMTLAAAFACGNHYGTWGLIPAIVVGFGGSELSDAIGRIIDETDA